MYLIQLISYWFFKVLGWKFVGNLPTGKHFLAIGGPHTSTWDFPVGMGLVFHHRLKISFLGKASLFEGAFGNLFRNLGGIPVDRSKNNHELVKQVIDEFESREQFILAMSPSGTRNYSPHWKSGFYKIARAANVPVLLCYIDFKYKKAGIGTSYLLTGNVQEDMNFIRNFYSNVNGKFPEKVSKVFIKEELES